MPGLEWLRADRYDSSFHYWSGDFSNLFQNFAITERLSAIHFPLSTLPDSITPELLYGLAKMGHGDTLVIADANFPSDSVAKGKRCACL